MDGAQGLEPSSELTRNGGSTVAATWWSTWSGAWTGRRASPSVLRTSLVWMTVLLTMFGLIGAGLAYELGLSEADTLLDNQLKEIAFYAAPDLPLLGRRDRRQDDEHGVLVQIRDAAGALVYSSDASLQVPPQAEAGFAVVRNGAEHWRSYTTAESNTTVQVSQRASVRLDLARTGALEAAIPILMTIPLGWLVVGWGLQRMLNSLSRLAGAIAVRGVESRSPIGLDDVPAEFASLVRAMNALIGRWRLSLEQQNQFLSDAAHELRTPLTALRLQIDLLRSDRRSAVDLHIVLPELARGAGRASTLVDQLLRMARYDADNAPGEHRDVDVVDLVIARIADHVALAESKAIDIGLVSAEPLHLRGVERDLGLLLSNLIENAVRYTPKGGVVDVGVRRDGRDVVIEVADTGPGIPEELMSRVFDRFYRVPGVASEGTGLGLAICRAIARRHGLALTLQNRLDGGLLVRVSGEAAG